MCIEFVIYDVGDSAYDSTWLIEELEYARIKNYRTEVNHYILFIKDCACEGECKGEYECYQEHGLIYKVMGENKYGMIMDPIGDGWYYHCMAYDYSPDLK